MRSNKSIKQMKKLFRGKMSNKKRNHQDNKKKLQVIRRLKMNNKKNQDNSNKNPKFTMHKLMMMIIVMIIIHKKIMNLDLRKNKKMNSRKLIRIKMKRLKQKDPIRLRLQLNQRRGRVLRGIENI